MATLRLVRLASGSCWLCTERVECVVSHRCPASRHVLDNDSPEDGAQHLVSWNCCKLLMPSLKVIQSDGAITSTAVAVLYRSHRLIVAPDIDGPELLLAQGDSAVLGRRCTVIGRGSRL